MRVHKQDVLPYEASDGRSRWRASRAHASRALRYAAYVADTNSSIESLIVVCRTAFFHDADISATVMVKVRTSRPISYGTLGKKGERED